MTALAGLLRFIDSSPTPFHAVATTQTMLRDAGFLPLSETEPWALIPGKNYFVVRGGTSLIALRVPLSGWGALRLSACHSDSPTFKVKPGDTVSVRSEYTQLNTEGYGGMLCASWFDRPLSVAGRVMVRTETGIEPRLVDLDRDLLIIPSVAIHMNREANSGIKYNAQVDLLPLYGDGDASAHFAAEIARAAGAAKEDVLASDLSLYNRMPGTQFGSHGEFFAAPRLDDLGCAYGVLAGFLEAEPAAFSVFGLFDNEEVGSTTKQGACSTFLSDTLKRAADCLGANRQSYLAALAGSVLVSADNAHAVHPNHPELSDPHGGVYLGKGLVVKHNANQKYTTDAVSSALFCTLCRQENIPLQHFSNRSDLPGGSTLGNLSNTQVSVNAVDIGLPQLAMHSCYETGGTADVDFLVRAMRAFYSTPFTCTADGSIRFSS